MLPRLQRALLITSGRNDLVLVVVLVTTIMMMILPLPTYLVDFLIATNIGLSVLTLMVGLYLGRPVDFSTMPAVILILTVFRLALAITTTRLVLLQADAGEIIHTFGDFVIAGNIIVGLVIFLIITVVQFIVITKGAERVAEVAARFTLDALPGKQMSIDSDLRNGDIDQSEARRRRHLLERESQLYGAMDGAMKFVKGDAIAGLVIIAINLIGGMVVGTMQHNLALHDAVRIYSLLTVGDGLVSQIPALFVSMSAATIVTRVASETTINLGSEITRQFTQNATPLKLAAVVLLAMAAVPGFPAGVFLLLAAGFGGAGFLIERGAARQAVDAVATEAARAPVEHKTPQFPATPSGNVVALIAANIVKTIDRDQLHEQIRQMRQNLYQDLGVAFPEVQIVVADAVGDDRYQLSVDGVPIGDGEVPPGRVLLRDAPVHAELVDVPYERGRPLLGQEQTISIEARYVPRLAEAGIGYLGTAEVLAAAVGDALSRYASSFVGIQETRALLAQMEGNFADLVREAQRAVSLQKIADVLRRLLDENVPIRNLRLILEALVEWGPKEQDVVLLTEYVRSSLKRQICHRIADADRVIAAYIFEREAEEAIRGAVRQTAVGSYLALSNEVTESLVDTIRTQLAKIEDGSARPVILASLDVRRFVRSMLVRNNIMLPVLSYQDLAREFTVQPIGSIGMHTAAAHA